jgi:hypothetical protein
VNFLANITLELSIIHGAMFEIFPLLGIRLSTQIQALSKKTAHAITFLLMTQMKKNYARNKMALKTLKT